jgi:hypothetical protein
VDRRVARAPRALATGAGHLAAFSASMSSSSRCADRPIHDVYGQTVRGVDAGVPHTATTIDGDGDGDDGDDGDGATRDGARARRGVETGARGGAIARASDDADDDGDAGDDGGRGGGRERGGEDAATRAGGEDGDARRGAERAADG